MDESAQAGASPESSLARTVTVTGTRAPFGGHTVDGVAVRLAITGGVVSPATTTSPEPSAWLPAASEQVTCSEYLCPLTARTDAENGPLMVESAGPPPVMLDRAHTGASSTSSVALTVTLTGTIALFGGDTVDGVAVSAPIRGAVTSGRTVTLTDDDAGLPDPSTQASLNVYVRPPTALTVPVFAPVTLKSAGDEPGPVMLASVQVGVSPESSVAAGTVVTVTI